MSVNIKWYSYQHLYPPPTLTSHYTPNILDSISRKSNRLRLKFVTKGNGKDVLWSTYTLRFTNSENLFKSCQAAAEELL